MKSKKQILKKYTGKGGVTSRRQVNKIPNNKRFGLIRDQIGKIDKYPQKPGAPGGPKPLPMPRPRPMPTPPGGGWDIKKPQPFRPGVLPKPGDRGGMDETQPGYWDMKTRARDNDQQKINKKAINSLKYNG